MKITSSTGVLSVAPVGTDPSDASAWTDIGWTDPDALRFDTDTVLDEPVYNTKPMLDTLREWSQKIEFAHVDRAAIGSFFGIPVVVNDLVPPSVQGIMFDAGAMRIFAPSAETRPFTPLEREGEWAKRTVRHGLTKALPWLRMDPGPDPDAAYTDNLYKTNLLASIAGGIL